MNSKFITRKDKLTQRTTNFFCEECFNALHSGSGCTMVSLKSRAKSNQNKSHQEANEDRKEINFEVFDYLYE